MIPEDHAIDIEYDLIAIVDGLPQNERDSYQLSKNLAGLKVYSKKPRCATTKQALRKALLTSSNVREKGRSLRCILFAMETQTDWGLRPQENSSHGKGLPKPSGR